MKVSCTRVWLLVLVWLSALAAEAQTHERLLIIEVSGEDEPAAARLNGLSSQPVARLRDAAAREVARARAALATHDASRAVVIDTAQHRVQVVERDGSVRTRLIEDEPTPFLVAFVASELLTLDTIVPPTAPTQQPARAPSLLARFDAQLAVALAHPYTTAWVVRPELALGLWFAARRMPRARPLLGVALAGPARIERTAGAGELSVARWDGALQLGLSVPRGRVRLLAFATAQAALQRAEFSLGVQQRALDLGVGLGSALELGLVRWLALRASAQLAAMPRRSQFTLYEQGALRAAFLMPSFTLSLVVHSPWR